MNAPGWFVAVATSLAVLTSCEESDCTAAGCNDGFAVYLVADEPLREGIYDIEMTMDGDPVTCQIVLPGGSFGAAPACSDSVRLRVSASIHNNGAAPDHDAPNAIIVDMFVAAAVSELKVSHDEAPLFEQTYRPTYQTVAPNGPECGPVCDWAPSQQGTLTYD
jgi:hypothetical protein